MKATGIVRRIDDLGRVVIPKELRRTMKIKEGDPLELYVNGDMICFKKYTPDNLAEMADSIKDTLGRMGVRVQVYDVDGDAITNARQLHRDIDPDSEHWFALSSNESDDVVAYVYVEVSPTDIQKAQVEAVVMMAGNTI